MISLRSILLIILILIIWRLGQAWYKRFVKNYQQNKNQSPPLTNIKPGTMLRCDYCGLYLPENEALREGNKVYCSHAHQQLANNSKKTTNNN